MAKFDLSAVMGLSKVSNLDTASTRMIDVGLLDDNPLNFFPVEGDLTDLCESIEVNGLLQPILVTPADNGRYRIIAGHRRTAAMRRLAEKDPERFRQAPCRVTRPASPELEELMLIQTNTEARELSYLVKNTAADRVAAILVKLQQEQGIKLPGKMRSNVAQILKTSESQLARAKYIKDHLEPELQKADLTDDAAYKLAHLPPEQQRELHDHYAKNARPGASLRYELTSMAIKRYKDNLAAGRKPFAAPPKEDPRCYHRKPGKGGIYPACDYLKRSRPKELDCPKFVDCCGGCQRRFECGAPCARISAEIEKHKQSASWVLGQAFQSIRAAKGWTREEMPTRFAITGASAKPDADSVMRYETGQYQWAVHTLVDFCKAYGTTPDAVLHFAVPQSRCTPLPWLRRLFLDCSPKEGELYLVVASDPSASRFCDVFTARWKSGRFVSAISGTDLTWNLVCFIPLSELPSGYSFSAEAVGNG